MLNLKYQNLNFYNPSKKNNFCKSFIINKESYQYLGSLFLLFNIGGNPGKGSKISEIIHEIAEHEYFRTIPGKTSGPVQNFERTVNKVNQAFTTLAESNHIEWVDKLHFSLASISNNQIQFVNVGNIKVFLLRNKTMLPLTQKEGKNQPKPTKIFTNIISGTLQKNDKLIFSTPDFFDFFSEDNLKQTFLTLPPNEACFKFQESLSKEPNNIGSISSIFIEITPKTTNAGQLINNDNLQDNYSNINNADNQNQKGIHHNAPKSTPSNTPLNNIKDYLSKASNFSKNSIETILSKIKKSPAKPTVDSFSNKSDNTRNKEDLPEEVVKNRQYIQDWKNSRPSVNPSQVSEKLLNVSSNLVKRYKKLSKTSRTLFLISSFLVLAFIVSIFFQAGSKDTAQKTELAEKLLAEASEKEKMAADVLIYSDFDKAKELLSEAQSILNNDEILNSGMDHERNEILDKINGQFDKVDKIIRINDPIVVSDIGSGMKIESIVGLEEDVYSFDQNNNAIFELDEESKKLGTISQDSENMGYFNKAGINSSKYSIIFVTDSPSIAEFDLLNKVIDNIDITFAKTDQEVTDLAIYNDRLYILDKTNNQIYKHTRSISGYSKGMEWINEADINISNSISMAIDGSIYLLNEDGTISNYLNGYLEDFSLETLTDPLSSPTKIFTLKDYDYLYILDPQKNRFVIFNKDGALVNQYISDSFTDMKDIYVDEINNKAYILCGDKIYGVVTEITE